MDKRNKSVGTNRRYICLLLLLSVLTVFLTGCLEFDIDMGIDSRHNAYLSYNIEMDTSGIDPQYYDALENALHSLGWHYQENLGFTVSLESDSDVLTLTMKRRTENDSFAQAFESLKAMLTDEAVTAFTIVDMSAESFPRQDSFIIDATLDIPSVIKQSNTEDLPPDLAMQFDSYLNACKGFITLTVPVSEVVHSSHDTDIQYNLATMTVPFDFSGQASFELRGSVIYSTDGVQIDSADDEIDRLIQNKDIVFAACAAALALLLIILLITLLRIRAHNKMFGD